MQYPPNCSAFPAAFAAQVQFPGAFPRTKTECSHVFAAVHSLSATSADIRINPLERKHSCRSLVNAYSGTLRAIIVFIIPRNTGRAKHSAGLRPSSIPNGHWPRSPDLPFVFTSRQRTCGNLRCIARGMFSGSQGGPAYPLFCRTCPTIRHSIAVRLTHCTGMHRGYRRSVNRIHAQQAVADMAGRSLRSVLMPFDGWTPLQKQNVLCALCPHFGQTCCAPVLRQTKPSSQSSCRSYSKGHAHRVHRLFSGKLPVDKPAPAT